MSGPKVVRVITTEEKIAISKRHLSNLDAAIESWEKQCQVHSLASADEIEHFHKRRKALHTLLDEKVFSKLQQEVQSEIIFIKEDLSERLERAAQKKAATKQQYRQLCKSATSLLARLEQKDVQIPDYLAADLTDIQRGKIDNHKAEITLIRALELIPTNQDEKLTEEQKKIAQCLGKGEKLQSFEDSFEQQESEGEKIAKALDHHLSELELLVDDKIVAPFQQRATQLLKEPSVQQQKMLADSLLINLASTIKEQKKRVELSSTLKVTINELKKLSSNHTNLIEEAEKALLNQDQALLCNCLMHVQKTISDIAEQQSDSARRRTILNALSHLGYDLHEGMETAWVENGNIALRNTSKPEMGVKLSGGHHGGSLQFRPVLFDPIEDPQEAEIAWCSDFKALKQIASSEGTSLTLEVAKEVGEVEVEIIEKDTLDHRRELANRPSLKILDSKEE